jgi:hypothetical protein
MTEWNDDGLTDIENLTLVCDSCHGLVKKGSHGWKTNSRNENDGYTGRTEWTPPVHIDPERRPRVNSRHHPRELLERAHSIIAWRKKLHRGDPNRQRRSSKEDQDPEPS